MTQSGFKLTHQDIVDDVRMADASQTPSTARIDGVLVHLMDQRQALDAVFGAVRSPESPLAVASINLDHIYHFGASGHAGGLARLPQRERIRWLNLMDGAPVVSQVRRLTGERYPKLSGSDLIAPILDEASRRGLTVGVLGGMPELTPRLVEQFEGRWPGIRFAGHWAPEREVLSSWNKSEQLAVEVRTARVDILLVCLGKPRQEQWIAEFGLLTGCGVLLAFGAVVDFLAGKANRCPKRVAAVGLEWLWRLAREPQRLARRYLIQGPQAYIALRRKHPSQRVVRDRVANTT